MFARWSKVATILGSIVLIVGLSVGCSSDGPTTPPIPNPATIRITNATLGKILFVFFRTCGTTNWGEDQLSEDPVEGVIDPDDSKDFIVQEGCYDLRADHLEGPQPGPVTTKTSLDRVAIEGNTVTWVVPAEPPGQE